MTAYEMRISDWSSDVCSSDLLRASSFRLLNGWKFMAKEFSRTQRIGDQMQRELALLIQREIKDPRLGLVTITAVDVSRDLSHAKIFITTIGRASCRERVCQYV